MEVANEEDDEDIKDVQKAADKVQESKWHVFSCLGYGLQNSSKKNE